MGGKITLGQGMAYVCKAFHVCLLGVHDESKLPGRESSENVLYLGCTDFFFIIISFYFLKRK